MINIFEGIIDFILDGVGQVFFMGSPLVGIIIIAALWVNSKKAALFALVGSIVGGLTAFGLGIPVDTVYFGIYGFNSVLTAIALGDTFLEKGKAAYLIATFGAFATAIITAALIHVTGLFGLPVETSGFVLTTWIILFSVYKLTNIKLAKPGDAPKQRKDILKDYNNDAPVKMKDFKFSGFIKLIFTGIAQVFFQENYITGILMFIGLTLASVSLVPFAFGVQYPIYFAGITVFIASTIGTLTAILLKADRSAIISGLFGFNAVLTSLAVMGVFLGFFYTVDGFKGSPVNFLMMIFAVVMSSIVTGFIGSITDRWGLPTLTAPFVFTSWLIELSAEVFPNIVLVIIPLIHFISF